MRLWKGAKKIEQTTPPPHLDKIQKPFGSEGRFQKKRTFYSQADCKRLPPLGAGSAFHGFFWFVFYLGLWLYVFLKRFFVLFWPFFFIICVPKRILQKNKSIFKQLLEFPIPPLTAAALQIIICKRPALILNHEKGIFVTPHNEVKCVLSAKNEKKRT